MKISIFLPYLADGGAERVSITLVNEFLRNGYKVDLLLANSTGNYFNDILPSVNLVKFNKKGVLNALPDLVCYLKREKPKILISVLEHANIIAILAKIFCRIKLKLIITVHSSFVRERHSDFSFKDWVVYLLSRFLYQYSDIIVTVSEGVSANARKIFRLPEEKVKTIYNAVINDNLFKQSLVPIENQIFMRCINDKKKIILAIGRLVKQKDYPTLIEAMRILKSRRHDMVLFILGQGKEEDSVNELIRKLMLTDTIHLLGFCNNPFAYLKKADLFVLASIWEALPTVLIEALALGVPIVSTDCENGPKEILKDGLYGKLVKVRDASELAEAIYNSLDNPIRYDYLKAVERFTANEVYKKYDNLIKTLL